MKFALKPARSVWLTALAVVVCSIVLVQAFSRSNNYYIAQAKEAGQTTLVLVLEAVDQTVGRFAPVPNLIAGEPAFRELLDQGPAAGTVPFVNEKLRQMAISVGASDIYLIDTTGQTIAASNYRDPDSFVGKNFSFRPYFQESLAGKSAAFHALGTTSLERGFFFSAPVLDGIEVIGVVALKITVGEIENDWIGADQEILIADSNGIVFLSSRPDYRFGSLAPLTDAMRETITRTKQFPLDQIVPIDLSADVIAPSSVQVTLGRDPNTASYLADSLPLKLAGWHAIALTPLQPVQAQVLRTMFLIALVLAVTNLVILLVLQRRASTRRRLAFEQEQRMLLEQKVQERTRDLDALNSSLRDEVAVRRQAEERLRESQKELVQAGKLAALGQMSAAISHEINQPLAAIKSYAENATEFLARDRVDDAGRNIKHISTMSDRMAEISHHLRNFARRPGDTLSPVDVADVIAETVNLIGPQLRSQTARVEITEPESAALALGGKLRLQQVLVNILTNALEAMRGQDAPLVEIATTATDDHVAISVRDHGPGIPEGTMGQVFDAFHTTKEAGSGMGLGMSISQNIISDFGGALMVDNHPDGGAVFTVQLQRVAADRAMGVAS